MIVSRPGKHIREFYRLIASSEIGPFSRSVLVSVSEPDDSDSDARVGSRQLTGFDGHSFLGSAEGKAFGSHRSKQ